MNHLLVLLLLNVALVAAAVFLHYEVLSRLSHDMPLLPLKPRGRIIFGVAAILLAHSLEVGLFAFGYWLSISFDQGVLAGDFNGHISDYMYFSYVTFTTVGYGDIVAQGHIRWLAAIESLTGFVLITWTASYFYIVMSQQWNHR